MNPARVGHVGAWGGMKRMVAAEEKNRPVLVGGQHRPVSVTLVIALEFDDVGGLWTFWPLFD